VTPIIEARGLVKRFRKKTALDGLDLVAEAGEVTAVLGPNGAGKTTFVRAVATLLQLDGGVLRVAGRDVRREPRAVRSVIGLAGQFAAVEGAMSGRENIELVARLYGQGRAEAKASAQRVLGQLALADVADEMVRTYSGGMRRRLDLAVSLVGSPRLLLLDEPTTGVDPRSRVELWEAIRGLVDAGTDVLMTTQYLDEADRLATRVAIVDRGRTVAVGTPDELKRRVGGDVLEIHASRDNIQLVAAALSRVHDAPQVDEAARRVIIPVRAPAVDLLHVTRALESVGATVEDLALRRPTLDEVFVALTGSSSDEPARDGDR
jgi:ABC-2 type transport system ATP-binding protein